MKIEQPVRLLTSDDKPARVEEVIFGAPSFGPRTNWIELGLLPNGFTYEDGQLTISLSNPNPDTIRHGSWLALLWRDSVADVAEGMIAPRGEWRVAPGMGKAQDQDPYFTIWVVTEEPVEIEPF